MTSTDELYEAPALIEIGDYAELTRCVWGGDCTDFLGCGTAWICV
ncbi:lasso RiPP family leader peptide-containing protein [Streptomyces sviceus]